MKGEDAASNSTASARASAKGAWSLVLAMLVGCTLFVVGDRSVIFYDEYHYAACSQLLHERVERTLEEPLPSARGADAIVATLGQITRAGRPAFYFPAAVLAPLLSFRWSLDLAILLDAWVYLGVLFFSIVRLMRMLAPGSSAAATGAVATLVSSVVVWQSATTLMGDLPVTALTAATVCAWLAALRGGGLAAHAWLGVAFAWGLLTKPIYVFHALPIVAHLLVWIPWTEVLRPRGPRRIGHAIMRFALAFGIPLIVLVPMLEPLRTLMSELYLHNETLRYYLVKGSTLENAFWPLTFLSQAFPIHLLPVFLLPWIASLASKAGRVNLLITGVLFAYLAFAINMKHAQKVSGLLVPFAIATGLGLAALPPRFGAWLARLLLVLALLMTVATVGDVDALNATVFRRQVIEARTDDAGELRFHFEDRDALLPRHADEYRALRVPEVVALTGSGSDPEIGVLVAFTTPRLNWSTYQSWLLVDGHAAPHRRRFFSNLFRHGGFGDLGGLSPRFFDARFVVVKSGRATTMAPDVELYHALICRELAAAASPLRAGLEEVKELEPSGGDRLTIFRRVRQPTADEWLAIASLLEREDPGNPWNARYAAKLIELKDELSDPRAARIAANWILLCAEDPDAGPELARRFVFRDAFPELTQMYREAWAAARALP